MSNRITVAEAARLIGASPQFVRVALQQKALDIGVALKMPGSSEYCYNISRKLLADYVGKDIDTELQIIRNEKISKSDATDLEKISK